jgi:hypothetical protein
MGVIPELGHVFETKMRAPFKCVFEVCRLSELITLASPRLGEQVDVERLDEPPEVKQEIKVEQVDDGSGTGGVGGLFSMTVHEEDEAHAHFEENPFQEIELEEAKPKSHEPIVEHFMPEIIEDYFSHNSEEINLDDW